MGASRPPTSHDQPCGVNTLGGRVRPKLKSARRPTAPAFEECRCTRVLAWASRRTRTVARMSPGVGERSARAAPMPLPVSRPRRPDPLSMGRPRLPRTHGRWRLYKSRTQMATPETVTCETIRIRAGSGPGSLAGWLSLTDLVRARSGITPAAYAIRIVWSAHPWSVTCHGIRRDAITRTAVDFRGRKAPPALGHEGLLHGCADKHGSGPIGPAATR